MVIKKEVEYKLIRNIINIINRIRIIVITIRRSLNSTLIIIIGPRCTFSQ